MIAYHEGLETTNTGVYLILGRFKPIFHLALHLNLSLKTFTHWQIFVFFDKARQPQVTAKLLTLDFGTLFNRLLDPLTVLNKST